MTLCELCGRNYKMKYNHFKRFHCKDVFEGLAYSIIDQKTKACYHCRETRRIDKPINEGNAIEHVRRRHPSFAIKEYVHSI